MFSQNNEESHYSTLGIAETASPEEIKKAYRSLSLKYHPDKGNDGSLFLEVKDAYEYLNNSIHENDQTNEDTNDTILNKFDSNTLKYYVSILKFFKERAVCAP